VRKTGKESHLVIQNQQIGVEDPNAKQFRLFFIKRGIIQINTHHRPIAEAI